MDLLLSMRGSKKTSEAGVWVADDEVKVCMCCKASFGLFIRKHHCRQCGSVVCGDCSSNRKFLESSRTGAPKRICDACHDKDRGRAGAGDDDDDDEDDDAPPVAAVARMAVGGGGGGGGGGSSARAGAGAGAGSARDDEPLPPAPPVAVPLEEALQALKDHAFEGRWAFMLKFAVVDVGGGRAAVEVKPTPAVVGVDLSAYNKGAAAALKGAAAHGAGAALGVVRAGSSVEVALQLKTKGAAYFQGECPALCQFGRDGKVTGALQRTSGKVNMTIQMTNNKTMTSFNFVGMVNAAGKFTGTFSGCVPERSSARVACASRASARARRDCAARLAVRARGGAAHHPACLRSLPHSLSLTRARRSCEISKNAGSVSGTFSGMRVAEAAAAAAAGEGDEAAAGDGGGAAEEAEEEAAAEPKAKAKGKKKAAKKAASSDEDDE
jgi:hypothetical protein